MKNLLGVMILATLPVACGTTTNPNAPELPATGAAGEASSFAASDRGRTAPVCERVTRVIVAERERERGRNVAYLDVLPLAESGGADTGAPLCGSPSWSVTPQDRNVRLTAHPTRNQAVLEAPRGTYVVTVSYPGSFREVSGSVTVTFR